MLQCTLSDAGSRSVIMLCCHPSCGLTQAWVQVEELVQRYDALCANGPADSDKDQTLLAVRSGLLSQVLQQSGFKTPPAVLQLSIRHHVVVAHMMRTILQAGGNGTQCQVSMTLTSDMAAPIFVYYELTHFYQNHRRYPRLSFHAPVWPCMNCCDCLPAQQHGW